MKFNNKFLAVLTFISLVIISCSEEDPNNPNDDNQLSISEIGSFTYSNLTPYFEDVFVQNNFAYVADNFTNVALDQWGLRIIDISDPKNPTEKSVFYKSFVQKCYVDGNYAYLATSGSGLIILDISNPAVPLQVGQDFSFAPVISNAVVINNYSYAACKDKDFCIFNVSNKSAPFVQSYLDLSGNKSDAVYVEGNFAYVLDQDSGLFVIDVSNISSPQLKGRFKEENYWDYSEFDDVVVSGNYCFIASIQNLHIVDITDKTKPVQIKRHELPAAGRKLFLKGDLLFVAANTDGILVYNISDPANPKQVGSSATPDLAFSVFVNNDKIFVADYNSGLRILQYH